MTAPRDKKMRDRRAQLSFSLDRFLQPIRIKLRVRSSSPRRGNGALRDG